MNVCECAYVCVRKCLSEHRGGGGGGSPGAWQYGAVVWHTPLVKMPPMGPGQLWPTYTASWAITSLMTYPQIHIYSPITTILATLSGCRSLFCLSVRNYLSVSLSLNTHGKIHPISISFSCSPYHKWCFLTYVEVHCFHIFHSYSPLFVPPTQQLSVLIKHDCQGWVVCMCGSCYFLIKEKVTFLCFHKKNKSIFMVIFTQMQQ